MANCASADLAFAHFALAILYLATLVFANSALAFVALANLALANSALASILGKRHQGNGWVRRRGPAPLDNKIKKSISKAQLGSKTIAFRCPSSFELFHGMFTSILLF